MRLHEFSNLGAMHAYDFLEDGYENTESVGTEHGSLGDLGDVFGFGDGDGETVARVYVQHDVDIRAAVTGVDNMVGPDFAAGLQLVKEGNFSVASGGANDGVDFTGALVGEFGAVDVIGGQNILESGADDFNRGGGEDVEIELIAF